MPHKKCPKSRGVKFRATRPALEHEQYELDNRPSLFSSQDMSHMAVQNRRARLISSIVGKVHPSREFAANFYGMAMHTKSPFLFTSHENLESCIPKGNAVYPTYPSLVQQTLRWNPTVESSSISQSDLDESRYHCLCAECTTSTCPSRKSSSSALRQSIFRDNIMTFNNQCTMTTRVNDACCGICRGVPPLLSTHDAAVAVCYSVDKPDDLEYDVESCSLKCPIPILKKQDNFSKWCQERDWCNEKCDLEHEAVRDTDTADYEMCVFKNTKCNTTKPRDRSENRNADMHVKPIRKMLYNEGISDEVASNCLHPPPPSCSLPRPYSPRPTTTCNHLPASPKYYDEFEEQETYIPYSHRSSKYHHDCKRTPSTIYMMDSKLYDRRPDLDEIGHLMNCSGSVKKALTKKYMTTSNNQCIQLPKRVLTSEKDIEAFITKRPDGQKCYTSGTNTAK